MALSDLSSDAESGDEDSQSSEAFLRDRFKVDNGNDVDEVGGEMLPNANEFARRNLVENFLASSSDDDDDDQDEESEKEDKKAKNGKEVKKEEVEEETTGAKQSESAATGNGDSPRKKKWSDDPSFMRIKLSEDSDSEVEKHKARSEKILERSAEPLSQGPNT